MKGGKAGTPKQDSQCRNEPNERRQQDEKTFQLISVIEVHRKQFPEWIPFQEVQETGVEAKRYRDVASFLDPGGSLRCRPSQEEPNRKRGTEERGPGRHTNLLGTTLTQFVWWGKRQKRTVPAVRLPV
jgi:hypothetical protein